MALDTMGLMGGTDVLRDISMRLEESHYSYLQLDESPSKLQERQKLEGFIKEYLCYVPNERKYFFHETAEILHRSAATVKDFSGYRACTAWRALSRYAANLLAQPWRKEYRTLRTYSGYYKHEVEANLIGAELMFELMGYKHTGLGVLTLEGPIDPDRVTNVSRDAIVASVECQILKEIWESVSQKFTVSWLEVLEYRCNFVGPPEQTIRALNFRFLERMHQSREKNVSTNTYRDYVHVPPRVGMEAPIATAVSQTIPYHAIQNNYNSAIIPNSCKPESVYPSEDGNFYFAPMDAMNLTNRCVNPYVCRPTMNYCYPMAVPTQLGYPIASPAVLPGHAARVPTGRLIELDPVPLTVGSYEINRPVLNEISNKTEMGKLYCQDSETDETDFQQLSRNSGIGLSLDDRQDYTMRLDKRAPVNKSSHHNVDSKNNDWEFVYKNLESRGYSKDLGERDDLLRKEMLEARNSMRNSMSKNSRSLLNIDRDDRYEKYGTCRRDTEKKKLSAGIAGRGHNSSSLDLPNGQENRSRDHAGFKKKSSLELQDTFIGSGEASFDKSFAVFAEKNGKKYSNTLPSLKNVYKGTSNETSASGTRPDTMRESKRQEIMQDFADERWNCATCTYLNSRDHEICEMCGKSRRKGNEDKPLASGGKECPKCTLVNDKNATICEVCHSSLEDSPTYI